MVLDVFSDDLFTVVFLTLNVIHDAFVVFFVFSSRSWFPFV